MEPDRPLHGPQPAVGYASGIPLEERFTTDPAAVSAPARAADSPPADLAALLVPGRTLTAADVAALRRAVGAPAWQLRASRLDQRDAALREALAACEGLGRTNAARRVARAWGALLRGAAPPADVAAPLHRAAELHGDAAPLSWQQIARVSREGRTPEACA